MLRKPKPLILAASLLVLLSLWGILGFRSAKPVYCRIGAVDFKVVRSEQQSATNLSFAMDYPMKQWARRQLDKVGVHLKGPRADFRMFPRTMTGLDQPIYLKLLCEGQLPAIPQTSAELLNSDLEFLDENGNHLLVGGAGTSFGPPGHFWLFWGYNPLQRRVEPRTDQIPTPASPPPRQFRIVRKSDQRELLSVPLAP